MSLRERFGGKQTQFYVELLYGVLFIAGFAYLGFSFDPRVAAFEGGLVAGYLLRVWEKMSRYERVLEETVESEVDATLDAAVDERVDDRVDERVDERVDDRIETEMGELRDEVDGRIEELAAREQVANGAE